VTRTGQLTPSHARPHRFEVDGRPIAALRAGASDAAPVLLLPGFTGSKEDFAPLFDPLAQHGFAPCAVDLPGQFESPGSDDPRDYAPDVLALVIAAIARQLGGRVHLLGHSFGGLVARACAVARPELFADLVLMSSGPAAIQGPRRARIEQLEPVLDEGLLAVYEATEAAYALDPGYVAPSPALAEFLRRRFLAGRPAMLRGMSEALRDEPDRVGELAAVGIRTLVLYGEADDAWPPQTQAQMAERLGASIACVPGAAHSPAVENTAATVTSLVAFWRGQGRLSAGVS
jgi:pimeloyl-ACP methyl ester carboxylesterase